MMIMELQQDDNNNNNQLLGSKDISQIIKGKRTKRQRPVSPLDLTIASASASANFVSTSSTEYQGLITSNSSSTTSTNCGFTEISTTTTTAATTTTDEEEDMANCLILLAQGQYSPKIRKNPITEKLVIQSEKSHHEISVIGNHNKSDGTSSGLFVYQCKTCDRCFSSFQALGGHRASHKKPKFNSEGNNKKALLSFMEKDNNLLGHHHNHHQFYQNSTITDLSLQISNRVGLGCTIKNKPKVHECSICGAEFTSGQALGGHMRRHRSFMNTQTSSLSLVSSNPESDELKKSRNMLELDLNLPAPEDDRRETKFPFAAKKQVIAFSHASPLVDCHY